MSTATAPIESIADVTEEIREIGPAEAEEILKHNHNNRPISWDKVSQYAHDMATGNWPYLADPIQLGKDGDVHDGQKRLHAVIKSGKRVKFKFITGLPSWARDYKDLGQGRSPAQQLAMDGEGSSVSKAAAAKLLIAWETGQKKNSTSLPQILQRVRSDPDAFNDGVRIYNDLRDAVPIRPSVVIVVRIKTVGVDLALSDRFFHEIAYPVPGSPTDALRRTIKRRHPTGQTQAREALRVPNQMEQLYYTVTAYWAWVKGERIDRVQKPRRGPVRMADIPMIK